MLKMNICLKMRYLKLFVEKADLPTLAFLQTIINN